MYPTERELCVRSTKEYERFQRGEKKNNLYKKIGFLKTVHTNRKKKMDDAPLFSFDAFATD